MAARDQGFSLIEALVAMTIMLVTVLPLVQLLTTSTQSNATARANSLATLLAVAKVEALRSIEWDAAALAPSPGGALLTNTPGYVDYLDGRGTLLNDPGLPTGSAPPGAVYVRRWSIEAPPAAPNTLVLQVVVRRSPDRGVAESVRMTAVRARVD
jgi:prepilin-type N-terminal cleavage/methylation domain-containing protein